MLFRIHMFLLANSVKISSTSFLLLSIFPTCITPLSLISPRTNIWDTITQKMMWFTQLPLRHFLCHRYLSSHRTTSFFIHFLLQLLQLPRQKYLSRLKKNILNSISFMKDPWKPGTLQTLIWTLKDKLIDFHCTRVKSLHKSEAFLRTLLFGFLVSFMDFDLDITSIFVASVCYVFVAGLYYEIRWTAMLSPV